MLPKRKIDPKQHYSQLRTLDWSELWSEEVAKFNEGTERERFDSVAVIRAVGVVFAESGPADMRGSVRQWLRRLLSDPQEKIRRYAMAAMPKIGADATEEKDLLSLLKNTTEDREKKHLAKTLNKIGGAATLESLPGVAGAESLRQMELKVKANVARSTQPSTVRLDRKLSDISNLRIHLRCRKGLERFLREEVEDAIKLGAPFRFVMARTGLLELVPTAAFSLQDIFALRCFASLGLVLGTPKDQGIEAMAQVIASPMTRRVLKAFTDGAMRYRLNFAEKGHQRGAVRQLATRAFELCPDILNDASESPWSIDIYPTADGHDIELSPRLSPDPRFAYRKGDVPAASHPPLAACMARLAGPSTNEVVWDPFCGSGLELVERSLLGGVRRVVGTDRSYGAIKAVSANFTAANLTGVQGQFECADFRDYDQVKGLNPNSVTLVISNPPMGRRVPIPNLPELIDDFVAVAEKALKPGGRLVFANPTPGTLIPRSLKLECKQVVDLGGFECRVEKYVKLGRDKAR
jgi:SAM-dependent methyltransferase